MRMTHFDSEMSTLTQTAHLAMTAPPYKNFACHPDSRLATIGILTEVCPFCKHKMKKWIKILKNKKFCFHLGKNRV